MHQLSRAVTALAAQGPRRPGPLVMFTLAGTRMRVKSSFTQSHAGRSLKQMTRHATDSGDGCVAFVEPHPSSQNLCPSRRRARAGAAHPRGCETLVDRRPGPK
jgi:hypothetical protein